MTEDQIDALRSSFRRAYLARAPIAERFYSVLFARAPRLRPLFAPDLNPQHRRLAEMLAYAVHNIDQVTRLQRTLGKLGAAHLDYGAKPEDFIDVGVALLSALREVTPGGLNRREDEAWELAIFVISGLMLSNMEGAEA